MKLNIPNVLKKKEPVAAGNVAEEQAAPRPSRNYAANSRRRKLSTKEKLILIVPALAVVIAAVLIYLLMNKVTKVTIAEPACQYYAGTASRISSGASLYEKDGEVYIEVNGSSQKMNSLPIYYTERTAVLLTADGVYVDPREDRSWRIDRFDELAYFNSTVIVRGDGKDGTVTKGFLFDGKDLYLFTEPVTLKFNGYSFDLPAMSYVEAVYGGDVMVFNSETKEFFTEPARGNVIAEIGTGDYKVSLLNDSMTLFDGSKSLLITRPELLDPIL